MVLLWRQLVTILLVISLLPGWLEVIENVEHLVHDGHLAHQVDHSGDEAAVGHGALETEHGCTLISHNCGCHSSVPVVLPTSRPMFEAHAVVTARERPLGLDAHPLDRAHAPPIPPPRA